MSGLPIVGTITELRRLRRNLRLPAPGIAELQRVGLSRVVEAARRTPLYRDRIPAGDVALTDLPLLTKPDFADLPLEERLSGPIPDGVRRAGTSGTTGMPIVVLYGPREAWWQGVVALRSRVERGGSPFDTAATIGRAVDSRRRPGLLAALHRRRRLELLGGDPVSTAAALERFKPKWVIGPATALIEAGEHLTTTYRPRGVITGGELLTDEQRLRVAEIFGTPVDTYGAHELGEVAWQCRAADLYHVNADALLVEVLDDAGRQVGPGGSGDVVATNLWNTLMPFIRYKIGDRAAVPDRRCACGYAGQALERIEGRLLDFFVDEHGRLVAPFRLYLSYHLPESAWDAIRGYRVIQDEHGDVRVEIVARGTAGAETFASAVESLRALLGSRTKVDVRVVDSVDVMRNGKSSMFISHRKAGSVR